MNLGEGGEEERERVRERERERERRTGEREDKGMRDWFDRGV